MPQTYEITAPNGKTLSITGDHVPNEAELHQIFAAAGVSTEMGPKPLPEMRMPAGTPARGRGTQLDLDKSNALASAAVTPLAHPTGVDAIDGMTSPLGLVSLAAGGAGVARAGLTGGAMAAAKTAIADAAPLVKYEATKTILEKMGVPSSFATVAAMAVSGYKKGAPAPAAAAPEAVAAAAPAASAGLSAAEEASLLKKGMTPQAIAKLRAQMEPAPTASSAPPAAAAPASPAASAPVAPAPPAAVTASTAAPPPTVESTPSAPMSQKALNEEALARRRAEYQARVQAEAATPPKPKLTAAEAPEYLRLIKAGKSHAEAMDAIQAARDFQARFGLTTPTAADARFPKGMRDYKTQP